MAFDFRLCEKIQHPQNSHSISSVVSSKSSLLEPMAKDLVDDTDAISDVDMDLESYMTAADETLRPESSLPSIEELTKNVQNLIDKDNADVILDEVNRKEEIKEEEKVTDDTKSESFVKVQEIEKCEEYHEIEAQDRIGTFQVDSFLSQVLLKTRTDQDKCSPNQEINENSKEIDYCYLEILSF